MIGGDCKIGQFKIRLKEDKLVFKQPNRHSETEKIEMRKVINELIESGIIRISDCPNCSPFFMVKKKDGGFRPVIDFKELNKLTVREDWLIPKVEELLHRLRNAKIFSTCDAK